MKAKFVNEEFEKGKKVVGRSTPEGQEQIIRKISDKGVKVYIGWDEKGEQAVKIVENIDEILKHLDLLHSVGVSYDKMRVSHWYSIQVEGYNILRGNTVILNCLTESDAENLIKILQKFTAEEVDFGTSTDRIHLRWTDDPWNQFMSGKTKPNEFDFLKDLEKNRKKYFGK